VVFLGSLFGSRALSRTGPVYAASSVASSARSAALLFGSFAMCAPFSALVHDGASFLKTALMS
jgi:hypothetical protein